VLDADRSLDVPDDLVELGRIVAAHGVRGQVKIQPHGTDADTLLASEIWWLRSAVGIRSDLVSAAAATAVAPAVSSTDAGAVRPVHVRMRQRHGDALVAHLEGVNDRDQAQALKGATLHLPRSIFPKTADDEYYWIDLIGCAVYGKTTDQQDVLLGQVVQVSDNGAHALLHVRESASMHDMNDANPVNHVHDAHPTHSSRPRERLIPFVAAHILRVALSARRIDSNWPADF